MCSNGLHRCCWALLAHFYPKKYPHNWHVLVLSLACYLVCTAGLSALSWFMERDSFLFACKAPVCVPWHHIVLYMTVITGPYAICFADIRKDFDPGPSNAMQCRHRGDSKGQC